VERDWIGRRVVQLDELVGPATHAARAYLGDEQAWWRACVYIRPPCVDRRRRRRTTGSIGRCHACVVDRNRWPTGGQHAKGVGAQPEYRPTHLRSIANRRAEVQALEPSVCHPSLCAQPLTLPDAPHEAPPGGDSPEVQSCMKSSSTWNCMACFTDVNCEER